MTTLTIGDDYGGGSEFQIEVVKLTGFQWALDFSQPSAACLSDPADDHGKVDNYYIHGDRGFF